MSIKVTERVTGCDTNIVEVGLIIPLLGSTGSKGPDFIIHGNS